MAGQTREYKQSLNPLSDRNASSTRMFGNGPAVQVPALRELRHAGPRLVLGNQPLKSSGVSRRFTGSSDLSMGDGWTAIGVLIKA
jgi:hypothetical protein